MTASGSPGPGWWQASDGNWYPPETHPDYQQVAFEPPSLPADPTPAVPNVPGPAQPVPAVAQPAPHAAYPAPTAVYDQPSNEAKPFWKQVWFLAALAAALLIGVIAVVLMGGSDEQADDVALTTEPASRSPEQDDEPDGSPQRVPVVDPDDEGRFDVVQAGEVGEGSLDNPFGYGAAVPVVVRAFGGTDTSTWNVTLSEIRDLTDAVAASNEFNDPPPTGVVFAGFDAEMTLASTGTEPLSPGFNFTWEILGGDTASVYDDSTIDGLYGCGFLESEFDEFAEVFVSGTLSGPVCIPIPASDLGHPETRVSISFNGDARVVFGQGGATPQSAEVGTAGAVTTGTQLAAGVIVPVTVDGFGDGDGSVWNTRVTDLRDITSEVADASEYNDAPPAGVAFVGFEVDMTLASANVEPLALGYNATWEILGGQTAAVYNAFTMSELSGCGSIDDEFADSVELFVGGSLSGTVCIPVPVEDIGHPDTRVAMNFGDSRVVFTASGSTPVAAQVEPLEGPAGVGNSHPLNEPIDVEWTTFGDGDGAIWSTTLAPLRDITDEVAEANGFDDPPPAGVIFAGFDAELTLLESDIEPLAIGFAFEWEILGGATNRVYNSFSLPGLFGCGFVDTGFDDFAEVFAGGTLTGTVCIPLSVEDLEHPDTRIALNFGDERRVTFVASAPG